MDHINITVGKKLAMGKEGKEILMNFWEETSKGHSLIFFHQDILSMKLPNQEPEKTQWQLGLLRQVDQQITQSVQGRQKQSIMLKKHSTSNHQCPAHLHIQKFFQMLSNFRILINIKHSSHLFPHSSQKITSRTPMHLLLPSKFLKNSTLTIYKTNKTYWIQLKTKSSLKILRTSNSHHKRDPTYWFRNQRKRQPLKRGKQK